tara:strand:+ start:1440 stop:2366 length:927 start_codon:yes stop_codon:yes gene_type:complete
MSNFIISLDFELKWGMLDADDTYDKNLLGVKKAIPQILNSFEKYNVKSTWAIVGLLFNSGLEEFNKYKPNAIANSNSKHSPYNVQLNKNNHDLYFAPDLINQILGTELQEVATHTYSHFCFDDKKDYIKEFKEDIKAAKRIAADKYNIELTSIVFPKNEINTKYFKILMEEGITHYRGNPKNLLYAAGHNKKNKLIRVLRYLDTFIKISNSDKKNNKFKERLINVQANRMLRPFIKNKFLNNLMLKRIKDEMFRAAVCNQDYHLWWHPHNFGINIKENMDNLNVLLAHFDFLRANHGMESSKMSEINY